MFSQKNSNVVQITKQSLTFEKELSFKIGLSGILEISSVITIQKLLKVGNTDFVGSVSVEERALKLFRTCIV